MFKVKKTHESGISVEIVEHSKNAYTGKEIVTVNMKYGLIVHGEWLRHRLFTNNVKSNRAIPAKVLRKEVLENPYVPVWMGQNQPGMVAEKECKHKKFALAVWKFARYPACFAHWCGEKLGLAKEVCNRLLMPWQWVRQTTTFTDADNLFNLRLHKDAQKDIQAVVKCLYDALQESNPIILKEGEWHTPYVNKEHIGEMTYWDNDGMQLTLEEALMCSASRCARSSYDKHDGTTCTKHSDIPLYEKLIESKPAHASPIENQATPVNPEKAKKNWKRVKGLTHQRVDGVLCSGNFSEWIQYRQTLSNHTCWNYSNA